MDAYDRLASEPSNRKFLFSLCHFKSGRTVLLYYSCEMVVKSGQYSNIKRPFASVIFMLNVTQRQDSQKKRDTTTSGNDLRKKQTYLDFLVIVQRKILAIK